VPSRASASARGIVIGDQPTGGGEDPPKDAYSDAA
jgi:hypothetical protein